MPLIIERDADEPDFATVLVDVSIAGRPYRLVPDTGGGIEIPMDLILGYPTIRQADWLLDFPAKRWAVTSRPRD